FVDKYTSANIIDINMGCPVNKIIKCEAGARWLLNPDKVYEMVSEVTKNVNKPVTVKIRIGWDENHILAVENAKAIEAAGASAIAIHGRTRKQLYEGFADWDIIKQVKQSVSIPVIGNGDITSPEIAKQRLDESGVDAIMIGRAALGNPWMIYRTVKYLETGELPKEPAPTEKVDVCLLHMDRLIQLKGEKIAILEMRKHAAWYLKGLRGNGRARRRMNEAETRDQMVRILYDFVEKLEGDSKAS